MRKIYGTNFYWQPVRSRSMLEVFRFRCGLSRVVPLLWRT